MSIYVPCGFSKPSRRIHFGCLLKNSLFIIRATNKTLVFQFFRNSMQSLIVMAKIKRIAHHTSCKKRLFEFYFRKQYLERLSFKLITSQKVICDEQWMSWSRKNLPMAENYWVEVVDDDACGKSQRKREWSQVNLQGHLLMIFNIAPTWNSSSLMQRVRRLCKFSSSPISLVVVVVIYVSLRPFVLNMRERKKKKININRWMKAKLSFNHDAWSFRHKAQAQMLNVVRSNAVLFSIS